MLPAELFPSDDARSALERYCGVVGAAGFFTAGLDVVAGLAAAGLAAAGFAPAFTMVM